MGSKDAHLILAFIERAVRHGIVSLREFPVPGVLDVENVLLNAVCLHHLFLSGLSTTSFTPGGFQANVVCKHLVHC